ncbi:probable hexosyltransferase MUCI70 isoform X2 [Magnolia sinica]|uniref:probable hexosyltransferase MUCI70 isoform X2 n=1 Tax=Magnolia sinica TaxID=86752 RepID=UPI00265A9747|nr:probable hexosyltransferase MUCI70 isoform X2 [Magnolia sinica]
MALYRHNSESLPERRDFYGAVIRSCDRNENGLRFRRGRKFGRVTKRRLSAWTFLLALMSLIYFSVFGMKLPFHGSHYRLGLEVPNKQKSKHRKQHIPCEVGFVESVDDIVEPKDAMNFTQFSIGYINKEEKLYGHDTYEPRFGGHQTLKERENSFYARNQTLHCGFVKGPKGSPSTGFDVHENDRKYMSTCRIVVSSCIFGSSDFMRRPTKKKISEYSQKNVCFAMFMDELTMTKLSLEGHVADDDGYVGLWKIVVVRNLPYRDMRKTGKVPKFLSHRLFPSARYSIWIDSKMRLNTDPMLILEYFLWRKGAEYAISNHYDRHCVWEEVLQNKRLNKYNHRAIDEQFQFYQSDGLTKFNASDESTPLPSYVPEGSFIVRAHTPMSNLFSCLWFNEVDRFTSRDQLSFAYTFLKLRRTNPGRPFILNMFKDCERRALVKLFHHRADGQPPPASL